MEQSYFEAKVLVSVDHPKDQLPNIEAIKSALEYCISLDLDTGGSETKNKVEHGEIVSCAIDWDSLKQRFDDSDVKSSDGFDQFLQDATLKLRDMWESRKGTEIDQFEAQSLNDVLTQWFTDKW